jgi:hypothetical protein
MHAPLPQSWMLKALMEAETGNSKYSKKFPPVWEVLLSLSPQLVAQINNLLEERAARKPDYDWSILLIDLPQALENRRSVTIGPFKFYLEDKNEEVNDIYVVLKYEENLREKQGKSSGRQRSISPESALSENSITPRRPSASLMPERSRSISRRMSSISRARSTLRNSYDPEELYDRDEQRAPRRPSRRSSSRVYNDYTPPAATRDYGYYPGGQQTQEYFATPDDRRPGPPSYIRPIIEDERRVRREPAEGQWHDRYQYFVQNMPPPPTRYPSTGASSYPSYGNPFSTPPVHLDPEILRDRARDAYYYSDNEPYSEKNPITRQQHAQERRRFNRSPVRDPVRDYYDNDNYADGMVHERVLNSRRAMSIQPIRRTNSLGRERDEIEDSDSDEINSHERRKNINQDHRRLNTEKDAKRHVTPRRHSVARDLKATVGDERDEDEFLSSEKEIADRLVAKHTRPLAEAKIPENERMSNGNGGGEGLHMPTRLSDIVEVDESDTSSKEGGNKEGNSSDGW